MGGNVGIIVKKPNGEQVGMDRWTNIMPYFFKQINLYLGNFDTWYSEFSEQWLEMKADYEKNKDTGKFELNMTSVYFPCNTQSPSEYGIIVVDFPNKHIYSSQDYCNIGSLAFYNIWNRWEDNSENEELLRQYFNHNMISKMSYYDRTTHEPKILDISTLNVDDVFQLLNEMSDQKIEKYSHPLFQSFEKEELDVYSCRFLIDSDWQFTVYNDRSIGILKVKQELDQNGFVFSLEDNKAWKDYLSWRWEDYQPNEDEAEDQDYKEFIILFEEVFNEPFSLSKD
jgi:hypothetical protein